EPHLVLLEIDHEQFQLVARDFLLLDGGDLPDAVRRIDDELAGLEAIACRGLFLLGSHTPQTPVLAPAACTGDRLVTQAARIRAAWHAERPFRKDAGQGRAKPALAQTTLFRNEGLTFR